MIIAQLCIRVETLAKTESFRLRKAGQAVFG